MASAPQDTARKVIQTKDEKRWEEDVSRRGKNRLGTGKKRLWHRGQIVHFKQDLMAPRKANMAWKGR